MGYLIENGAAIKKLVIFVRETEMQTLNTANKLLIPSNGSTIPCIISAFITGAPNGISGSFTFNSLRIGDGATLFQCMLDLQNINASTLSTQAGFIFQPGTFVNYTAGGKHDTSKPLTLSSNADDLTGTGDFEITLFYYDLPTQ